MSAVESKMLLFFLGFMSAAESKMLLFLLGFMSAVESKVLLFLLCKWTFRLSLCAQAAVPDLHLCDLLPYHQKTKV